MSPDSADNRFLECAEAAQADFLVTGNIRDFPQRHGTTEVLSTADFLIRLNIPPA